MENKYETLQKIINEARQIVVFTGAGISVPSGIPDFRSANGIYNQKTKYQASPEEIISHTFFQNYTEEFYEFYNTLKNSMSFIRTKCAIQKPNQMPLINTSLI